MNSISQVSTTNNEKMLPARGMPARNMEKSTRTRDRTDVLLSRCKKSKTSKTNSRRPKLRANVDKSKVMVSITNGKKQNPAQARPTAKSVLPGQAQP